MGRRVENLCPLLICQEVDSLIDVFVEAIDFSEGLKRNTTRKGVTEIIGISAKVKTTTKV